jgi:hypothetical protein
VDGKFVAPAVVLGRRRPRAARVARPNGITLPTNYKNAKPFGLLGSEGPRGGAAAQGRGVPPAASDAEIVRLARADPSKPLPPAGASSIIHTCQSYGVALHIDENSDLVVVTP